MEQHSTLKQGLVWKNSLAWALGTGGAIAVFQFLLAITGPSHHDLVYNLDLLMLIVGVVFAHRAYRAHYADHAESTPRLSYIRALGSGAVFAVLAGLVSRLALYLQLRFYDDSLLGMIMSQWQQVLEKRGLSPQEIETKLTSIQLTPESFAWGNFQSFVVTGLLLSLIVSAFTRQRHTIS